MLRGPSSGRRLRGQDLPYVLRAMIEECRCTLDPEACWPLHQPYMRIRGVAAHRWIAAWRHGEVPAGRVVRHTCDNPNCINPWHLVIGSQAENVRDMLERGRAADRSGIAAAAHAAGKMNTNHLTDREHHPRNRAVLGPDGARYPNATLAAEAAGVTRQAMSHRCRLRRCGWRYE